MICDNRVWVARWAVCYLDIKNEGPGSNFKSSRGTGIWFAGVEFIEAGNSAWEI